MKIDETRPMQPNLLPAARPDWGGWCGATRPAEIPEFPFTARVATDTPAPTTPYTETFDG
jgi:hypothetical protein